MQPEFEEPLQKAVSFLEKSGYRYAVIGGIAVSQWSGIRATEDVDIKVLVPDMDYQGVRQAIRQAFPELARTHIPENPFIVAVKIDQIIVDFLLTLPGYEENIINRAINLDFGNFGVWICSAEDLIIQKAVADRGKDWPDIENLLIDQWGNLDHQYIEYWLAQFSEALEQDQIFLKYSSMKKKVAQLFD